MNLEHSLPLSWRTTALSAVVGRGPEWELWQRFVATRDPALREQLVQHHARLAKVIAARMYAARSDRGLEYFDFHHFALVALIESIDRFEPERGVRFASFASARIRGAIVDGVQSLSEQQQQVTIRQKLIHERTSLLAEGLRGDAPGSARPGAQASAQTHAQANAQAGALARLAEIAVSLAVGFMLEDTGMFVDESAEPVLPDNAYQSGELRRTRALIQQSLDLLEPRERKILTLHYLQGESFKDIALQMDLTRGRVSQLHHQALGTLKQVLTGRGLTIRECT